MSVALAVRQLSPALLAEVRAACRVLGMPTEEWVGGIPRHPPQLVITALEPGERRLPEELCALLDASPGLRAVVCASEPLVKPRVTLGQGRVVLLAPPLDRVRMSAILRSALGVEAPASASASAGRTFEALRRQYWVAWARGVEAPPVTRDEQSGLCLAFGEPSMSQSLVHSMTEDVDDAQRAANLTQRVGSAGAAIQLSDDAADWLFYWPRSEQPLWICSPHRLPVRWDAAAALQNRAERLLRLPAFPGDRIVCGWSTMPTAPELFGPLKTMMLEGALEGFAGIVALTEAVVSLGGAVVELR